MNKRPEAHEYADYYLPYVNLIPDGEIEEVLTEQANGMIHLLEGLSSKQEIFRYAKDKWTIKEVLGHVADTERIMAFRLLSIARGETYAFPGFDETKYVQNASFNQQTLSGLLENYKAVRKSTILLLKGLAEKDWSKIGKANNTNVTVRALAYIISGHDLHHQSIIKERYLKSPEFPRD